MRTTRAAGSSGPARSAITPSIAAVTGIVVLGLLAIPALDLRLGAEDFGQLPTDTTERQAYDALSEGFGVGTNGPLLIAVNVTASHWPPTRTGRSAQQRQAQLSRRRR